MVGEDKEECVGSTEIPSRLLDWSDSVLVALHFAVRNKTKPFDTGGVIYIPDPHWLDDLLDRPLLGPAIAPRSKAPPNAVNTE